MHRTVSSYIASENMAALVPDVDLDERLYQSGLSDVLAEETSLYSTTCKNNRTMLSVIL